MPQKRMECFRLLLEDLAWIEHQLLSGIRDSRKAGSLWGMMRGVGGVRKSMHQRWLVKGLGLGLLCWGFKGSSGSDSVGRGQHSSNRISGIFNISMHQSITPSLSQTLTKMGIETVPQPSYSPDLAPCDFWLFPKLEALVMRQLRRWKRLWRRSFTRLHKRTSMGRSRSCWNGTSALQPEEITSKETIVSFMYYQ